VSTQKISSSSIFFSLLALLTISLTISVNYAAAESEDPEYNFTVLTGDDLINNPLTTQILQKIELAKQWLAEQVEKQRQAEEYQSYLDEQRLIAKQQLQKALDQMNKKYQDYTPKSSFETFLSKIDPSVHDIFWGQFEFQQQKVQAGRDAMSAVYANGGSLEEAREAFFQKAATKRTEIIEVNNNLNIKYGFADPIVQQTFDKFGKLPRSDDPETEINFVSKVNEPISEILVAKSKSTLQINFEKYYLEDKCLKWELKLQKFLDRGFIHINLAKKAAMCDIYFQ